MGKGIYATSLMRFDDDDVAKLTPHQSSEPEAGRRSFRHFLRYWHFRNRETDEIGALGALRLGQERFADLIEREPWLFRQKNARAHLAAREESQQ